jgi:cytidylate kinase
MKSLPSQIAIDGPVASGKTVVGRLLAQRLGYRFLDTGLMYRAITWLALKEGVPLEGAPLTDLAGKARIRVADQGGGNSRIIVNDVDVTDELRSPAVEGAVSVVSAAAGLREVMVEHQRAIAREGAIVMVGRDIGTVVLPDAGLKVFLRASVAERASRRYRELREMGKKTSYKAILDNLKERDTLDSQRAHAPLQAAEDARILDTDGIGVEEVVERVLAMMDGTG